jgi:hypothetical protein
VYSERGMDSKSVINMSDSDTDYDPEQSSPQLGAAFNNAERCAGTRCGEIGRRAQDLSHKEPREIRGQATYSGYRPRLA